MTKVEQTSLSGVVLLEPRRFGDARGWFSESWNRSTLQAAGISLPHFVQDNHSFSRQAGTVRGLYFQAPPHAQGKLVRCGRGRPFYVAVDIRRGSPTYGRWFSAELTFENGYQLRIPAGFLLGFMTLTSDTEIVYKCNDHYAPECDGAVLWDSCGFEQVLSDKDARPPMLPDFDSPFVWEGAA